MCLLCLLALPQDTPELVASHLLISTRARSLSFSISFNIIGRVGAKDHSVAIRAESARNWFCAATRERVALQLVDREASQRDAVRFGKARPRRQSIICEARKRKRERERAVLVVLLHWPLPVAWSSPAAPFLEIVALPRSIYADVPSSNMLFFFSSSSFFFFLIQKGTGIKRGCLYGVRE